MVLIKTLKKHKNIICFIDYNFLILKGVFMELARENELKLVAKDIRKKVIEMIGYLGVGHIGGSMSIVEVLTILYYKYLNIDPENPLKEDRDLFVLSKGHSGPALYATLASKGFFPEDWLKTLNQGGTRLPSHVDRNKTPGVDMTAGSLGQGLSAAVGMALGSRLSNINNRVYCIIGDGESNEGQIWEAAMAAAQFKLSNLIVFTDYNKMQIDGYLHEIMNIEDITSKWLSFGWYVQRINGHCFQSLDFAIERALNEKCRPSMIILDTIKGKGFSPGEGKVDSHNMTFDIKVAEKAIEDLERIQ